MNILIIGASRGIGLEFVRQYRADKAQVTATARSDEGLKALRDLGATALQLDVASTESGSRLGWQIEGAAFDVAIVVAGVYGPSTRGLQPPTEADFDTVMNLCGVNLVIRQPDAGCFALSWRGPT